MPLGMVRAILSQRLVPVNMTTLVDWVVRFSAVWLFPFPPLSTDGQIGALSLDEANAFLGISEFAGDL